MTDAEREELMEALAHLFGEMDGDDGIALLYTPAARIIMAACLDTPPEGKTRGEWLNDMVAAELAGD